MPVSSGTYITSQHVLQSGLDQGGQLRFIKPIAFRAFRDVRDIDHSVTVHAETTMDAAALGLKRIREQQFVMEDLADPVMVELVTSTQHKVSLKKVVEWMAHAGGVSPKEIAMKARVREG